VTDLLQPQRIQVRAEGSLVVLTIGNVEFKMDYAGALEMSRWLRIRGKEAKRNAGDTSRHWSVVGTLETLEQLREAEKQFWR
jgi:hypothetical protein